MDQFTIIGVHPGHQSRINIFKLGEGGQSADQKDKIAQENDGQGNKDNFSTVGLYCLGQVAMVLNIQDIPLQIYLRSSNIRKMKFPEQLSKSFIQ